MLVGLQVPATPAAAAIACEVDYTVQNDWNTGFTASVTINNLGDPVTEWTLEWDFPGDQQVTNGWSGTWDQTGAHVTVSSLSWNGSLGTGDSTTIGFNGSYTGSNPSPTGFVLNDVSCDGGNEPPGTDPVLQVDPAGVSVPEGDTAMFDVALSEQPSADVTVSVAKAGGDADITLASGGSLEFTADNWDVPQQVTLAAAQDEDEESGAASFTVAADGYEPVAVTASEAEDDIVQSDYAQRFIELYQDIKDPASGYFSDEGVPYHSVETLIVEAPDYGHETTSETFSYWLWLEASYGRVTGDWAPFNEAWAVMEEYMIPSAEEQPSNSGYDPSDPADYVGEYEKVTEYPAPIDASVPVGQDPLANELSSTYGTDNIYGMHWLLDTDDWYEYNEPCHPDAQRDGGPTLINTFQRGAQESVWETVTHPSCETFEYGAEGEGFLTLFVDDEAAQQWRYTNAPDADARAVQVAYWAQTWAEQQGNASAISASINKAAKMGDYLRYAMYDKYFKTPGCESLSCPAGDGKDSAHYLMSWYYAWGGALQGNWAWRIGSSHNHFGYQNPMAAWALSQFEPLIPRSPTAQEDWATSLDRQLEFYRWLQSAEGGIAGGATNSWKGHYADAPDDLPTFYGMTYDWAPVYHDPPSSEWFGWQAWSMERVAEYYYLTDDQRAGQLLDKWVDWALSEVTLNADGTYQIPSTLSWTGAPDDWNPDNPGDNAGLHVSVEEYTQDVGVTGSLIKALMYYAAATGDTEARNVAKELLDRMWTQYRDEIGVSVEEVRSDYDRFDDTFDSGTGQGLYIPEGWTGEMGTGDEINSDSTFLSIRSKYTEDTAWPEVEEQLSGGDDATFNYHRFWAQVDVATALATYDRLFA